jgi:hypothetical protein
VERFQNILRNRRRVALLTKGLMTYQGYRSYETWAVALWMDNDQASYQHYRELAKEIREVKGRNPDDYLSKRETDAMALADALRGEFEEASPVADQASVYADLMNAALLEVDWFELANQLLEGLAEEANP